MTASKTSPKPRLTVADLKVQIDEMIAALKEQFAAIEQQSASYDEYCNLVNQLDLSDQENVRWINELWRKSQGITSAHKRIARVEAELKALTLRAETASDPLIVESVANKLESLETRLETLFGDLSQDMIDLKVIVDGHTDEIADLRTDVDGLIDTTGVHTTRIGMLEEGQTSLSSRVTTVEGGTKFPIVRFVISLFIGLFAGLIWHGHTFGQSVKLADGTTFFIAFSAANSVWAALLFGIAMFALSFGMLSIVRRTSNSTEATTRESTTRRILNRVQQKRNPAVTSTPPSPAPVDEAPTKVLVTPAGATGARK